MVGPLKISMLESLVGQKQRKKINNEWTTLEQTTVREKIVFVKH